MEINGMEDIEIENTSVEEIDSENVNLIFIGIDSSGSMGCFESDMSQCLNGFKDALVNSKESDEILVARADFNDMINVGGYKKINQFDTAYDANGGTAMYDVIVTGADKLISYIDFLKNEQNMRVKAVFAIFSDGYDNASRNRLNDAKRKIEELNNLEITTAFISFGNDAISEAKRLDFKNLLNVTSSASELRKAFNCLSKSVIESSQSVLPDGDGFFGV
jgi:uncharacterized protein YegL